jgi:hypothetical protein
MSCAAEVVGQLLSSRSWLGVIGRVGWRMIKIMILIGNGRMRLEMQCGGADATIRMIGRDLNE